MTTINLTELFETQRLLDAEIERKHPSVDGEDRLAKRILALQVELGECANEWRGFKFWSNDQEACVWTYRSKIVDGGPGVEFFNPLLEEYVDCLHFILSIGLEMNVNTKFRFLSVKEEDKQLGIVNTFSGLLCQSYTVNCDDNLGEVYYFELLSLFVALGEMLGFTWERIESAYMSKNAINWKRQEEGY